MTILSRRLLLLALPFWAAGCHAAVPDRRVRAYRVDRRRERIGFHWLKPDGTPYDSIGGLLAAIDAQGTVRMVTNGGIYGTDLRPLGLYIERGRRLSPINLRDGEGNFFLKPNGVFFLRGGRAGIVNAARFRDDLAITDALQSGPLMIENGVIHPRFRPASTSRHVRNAAGITRAGDVVFLCADNPISFYDFSALARDEHGVSDLLYLDGTLSQMYVAPGSVPTAGRPFVTMLSVTRDR